MAVQRLPVFLLLLGCCSLVLAQENSTTIAATTRQTPEISSNTASTAHASLADSNTTNVADDTSKSLGPTSAVTNTTVHSTTAPNRTEAATPPASNNETSTHVIPPTSGGTNETNTGIIPPESTPSGTNVTTTLHVTNNVTTVNSSSVAVPQQEATAHNPGLIAVLCIFISILVIVLVVVAVKFFQKSEPEFKKLDELPMNNVNEEAPFARYPPK